MNPIQKTPIQKTSRPALDSGKLPLGPLGLWRDDNELVIHRTRAQFPSRCVKGGPPDDLIRHQHSEVYVNQEVVWIVVGGALVTLLMRWVSGERLLITMPLSQSVLDAHQRRKDVWTMAAVGGALGFFVSFGLAFAFAGAGNDALLGAAMIGMLASIVAMIVGAIMRAIVHDQFLRIRHVDGPYVWIDGVADDCLAPLAAFPGRAAADQMLAAILTAVPTPDEVGQIRIVASPAQPVEPRALPSRWWAVAGLLCAVIGAALYVYLRITPDVRMLPVHPLVFLTAILALIVLSALFSIMSLATKQRGWGVLALLIAASVVVDWFVRF